MKKYFLMPLFAVFVMTLFLTGCSQQDASKTTGDSASLANVSDPLPSWSAGDLKTAVISLVTKTTTEGNPDFVPVSDRIACFDNDGTLWCEQPYYFQLDYALYQIRKMEKDHPEWKNKEPFKSILNNDLNGVLAGGEKAIFDIVIATHAGISVDSFNQNVTDWMANARHPKTGKPFNQMVYQPMLELLEYLRANGYKTFIVSGGGIDFMRVWTEATYGIPPYQVVGSSGKVKYEVRDGKPVLLKLPEIEFIDDKEGKPVGIHQHIGKRPIFTVGNSDGDYAMLQYTSAGTGPRLGMIIHHTDADREYAYDRGSHIGKLEKGLDDAATYGWLLVDMKNDWKTIFPD